MPLPHFLHRFRRHPYSRPVPNPASTSQSLLGTSPPPRRAPSTFSRYSGPSSSHPGHASSENVTSTATANPFVTFDDIVPNNRSTARLPTIEEAVEPEDGSVRSVRNERGLRGLARRYTSRAVRGWSVPTNNRPVVLEGREVGDVDEGYCAGPWDYQVVKSGEASADEGYCSTEEGFMGEQRSGIVDGKNDLMDVEQGEEMPPGYQLVPGGSPTSTQMSLVQEDLNAGMRTQEKLGNLDCKRSPFDNRLETSSSRQSSWTLLQEPTSPSQANLRVFAVKALYDGLTTRLSSDRDLEGDIPMTDSTPSPTSSSPPLHPTNPFFLLTAPTEKPPSPFDAITSGVLNPSTSSLALTRSTSPPPPFKIARLRNQMIAYLAIATSFSCRQDTEVFVKASLSMGGMGCHWLFQMTREDGEILRGLLETEMRGGERMVGEVGTAL